MLKKIHYKKTGTKPSIRKSISNRHFLGESIKAIYLENDILKIEYTNRVGNIESLDFTNHLYPDLNDVEYFLMNTVHGYLENQASFATLTRFAKMIYAHLMSNIKTTTPGNGFTRNIEKSKLLTANAFARSNKISRLDKQVVRLKTLPKSSLACA